MKKLFKNRNLIIFLVGTFISGIGTRLDTIALTDKIFQLTGSNFSISMVFILEGLPMLFLGVIAGNFVDKQNKKHLFIIINIVFALTALVLGAASSPITLYGTILVNGIINTIYLPTLVALMPLLVDREDLAEANGLKVSISGVISIIGYAIAGMIVAYAGSSLAFIIDSVSFMFIALISLLLRVKKTEAKEKTAASPSSIKLDIREGWNFIKSNTYVKYMFFLDVLTRFIIAMQIPLTFVFIENYLGGQLLLAKRSGLIFSAAGVGTLIGGFLIGKFKKYNQIRLLSVTLLCDGIVVSLFALNRSFPVSLVLYGVLGIIGAFMGTLLVTVIQKHTPENILGRVSGFINTIAEPLSVISIIIGGTASNFVEVKYIFILCACSEIITALYFL
ncbi:MAG: arabinose efflux permease family protein, partial [Clostridiales bacterium]|nr:arabinose efflux permease family protein [Clostridiales bacterium]